MQSAPLLLVLAFGFGLAGCSTCPDVPGYALKAENARGERVLVNVDEHGVALEGHDPVAYFTEHRPVLGKPELEATYDGATYRFASMEDREAFERAPETYVPSFGGFCAYAASIDKLAPVDVNVFQIADGRLLLQHSSDAYRLFNEDAAGNLTRADQNWPGLVSCQK
jgi:YHS domain-containing protein